MAAAPTLFTFMYQNINAHKVDLYGSWDHFTNPLPMKLDLRRGGDEWIGCHTLNGSLTEEQSTCSGSEHTPQHCFEMGATYWYYYNTYNGDGTTNETYNNAEPFTTYCPYMPGQAVNVLEMPVDHSQTHLGSRNTTRAPLHTLDPDDRYINPRPPPSSFSRRAYETPGNPQAMSQPNLNSQLRSTKPASAGPWPTHRSRSFSPPRVHERARSLFTASTTAVKSAWMAVRDAQSSYPLVLPPRSQPARASDRLKISYPRPMLLSVSCDTTACTRRLQFSDAFSNNSSSWSETTSQTFHDQRARGEAPACLSSSFDLSLWPRPGQQEGDRVASRHSRSAFAAVDVADSGAETGPSSEEVSSGAAQNDLWLDPLWQCLDKPLPPLPLSPKGFLLHDAATSSLTKEADAPSVVDSDEYLTSKVSSRFSIWSYENDLDQASLYYAEDHELTRSDAIFESTQRTLFPSRSTSLNVYQQRPSSVVASMPDLVAPRALQSLGTQRPSTFSGDNGDLRSCSSTSSASDVADSPRHSMLQAYTSPKLSWPENFGDCANCKHDTYTDVLMGESVSIHDHDN